MFTQSENERESDFTLEWVSHLFSGEICFYNQLHQKNLTNATVSKVSEWGVTLVVYEKFLKKYSEELLKE